MSELWSWERRSRWLVDVESIERKLGKPIFSNMTKIEVATGLSEEVIQAAQEQIYSELAWREKNR